MAAGDGVVAAVGCDPTANLVLPHGGGWPTLDAHLQPLGGSGPRLRLSDGVPRGDPIGRRGSLGVSIGSPFTSICGLMVVAQTQVRCSGVRSNDRGPELTP